MKINLCEIIDISGAVLPFSCELETERLETAGIKHFTAPPKSEGQIKNSAGALTLTGTIFADLVCLCDRCGEEFQKQFSIPLNVKLAAELEDEENPNIFPLDGDWLDLSDVLETCFIFCTEAKFLCREDCAGLCSRCGKNLNYEACVCVKEIDPRLAVLQQLLDKEE